MLSWDMVSHMVAQGTDELVGANEAAEILCVASRTVRRLVGAGELATARKLPGRTGAYLFRRADVEALREQRAQGAAA